MIITGTVCRPTEGTYDGFGQMLTVHEDVNSIEMWTGPSVQRDFVHDLPVCTECGETSATGAYYETVTGGRTFALRIDALAPRILEGARQAHPVQDGNASRECAINSLSVVIDV